MFTFPHPKEMCSEVQEIAGAVLRNRQSVKDIIIYEAGMLVEFCMKGAEI